MADPPRPDGDALWRQVAATVRPLPGRRVVDLPAAPPPETLRPPAPARHVAVRQATRASGDTLDGGWDRRLKRGAAAPDATIDLHDMTLAAAYAALQAGLARAVAGRARVVLLVTGRPPRAGTSRLDAPLRGIIRASVEDWLRASPHAAAIAAIRPAHPRHGGAGALYIVLRRTPNRT